MLRQLLFILFLTTPFLGCVSVKLAGTKPEKAQGIVFSAPDKPFVNQDNKSADYAWISKTSGNTIAILSDCSSQTDSPLSSLESDTLSVFSDPKINKTTERQYNGRIALFTSAEGFIDGVPMHISLVTLKKNGCDFTLSFFGRKQFKDTEVSAFEKFVKEFKAP
jgi:hypothetical protein